MSSSFFTTFELLLPGCKPFSFRTVFEDPITGSLAVAVRDDHSPIVVLGFLRIFGSGNAGILPCQNPVIWRHVSSASTPPLPRPIAAETDSPPTCALPFRIESALRPSSCAVYPVTFAEPLHLIGN